jgi:hypothetical protein
MNKKRIFVLGVALVLFALVAGVAFAGGWVDGVHWMVLDNANGRERALPMGMVLQVHNSNDYSVRVIYRPGGETYSSEVRLAAGETKNISVGRGAVVTRVEKQ